MRTKGKVEIPSNYNRDIKSFKCLRSEHIVLQYLNKRIMVMREHEDIEFKSENSRRMRCHHMRTIMMLSIQLIERL